MQLDALLLAAGLGTRLRPLTLEIPKALLPLYGVPLLDLHIARLLGPAGAEASAPAEAAAGAEASAPAEAAAGAREGGVAGAREGGAASVPAGSAVRATRVVVNGHHLAEHLREHLERHAHRARLAFSHEPQILGTGGAIRRAAGWLHSDPFLVLNTDALFPLPGADAIAHHRARGLPATMVLAPSSVHPNVLVEDGRVTAILRDRVHPRGLTYTGCCLASPEFQDLLPVEGFCDLRDAFDELIAAGRLGAWIMPDDPPLVDVGTPERYLAAHRMCAPSAAPRYGLRLPGPGITLAAGSGFIAAGASVGLGARVRDSVVLAGSRIDPGVTVRGSIVGPGVAVSEDLRNRLLTAGGLVTLH